MPSGSPLGKGTVLLRGPVKGREVERHFGKALPVGKGSLSPKKTYTFLCLVID